MFDINRDGGASLLPIRTGDILFVRVDAFQEGQNGINGNVRHNDIDSRSQSSL